MPLKTGLISRFNTYKKQGLTDSDAMKRAMNDQAGHITKIRKKDAAKRKKKETSSYTRLKKDIHTLLTGPGHSKAGKKYLKGKK